MRKFIVKYNAGFGENETIIEARTVKEVENLTYSKCLNEVERKFSWSIEPLNVDNLMGKMTAENYPDKDVWKGLEHADGEEI